MKTVVLGRTRLEVTPIAYGTWQFGGDWGAVDEKSAISTIAHARARGINFFDTAQGYGFGRSERILGRALADELATARADIVLATKGGLRMDGDTLVRDSSPEWLRSGVESSLTALGVDYIDLYQVHWPDPSVPIAESASALRDLVTEGLVRHVGVSNFSPSQMDEFSRELPVETVQPPYHLFRRDIEKELLDYTVRHDIGVLAYGPLAHGLLGGGIDETTTFPADDWRSHSPVFSGNAFARNLEAVQDLAKFAAARGATIGQLAVAWVLANPAVEVAIVGSRKQSHLDDSIGALDLELTGPELAEIDQIMTTAVPVGGPNPEGM